MFTPFIFESNFFKFHFWNVAHLVSVHYIKHFVMQQNRKNAKGGRIYFQDTILEWNNCVGRKCLINVKRERWGGGGDVWASIRLCQLLRLLTLPLHSTSSPLLSSLPKPGTTFHVESTAPPPFCAWPPLNTSKEKTETETDLQLLSQIKTYVTAYSNNKKAHEQINTNTNRAATTMTKEFNRFGRGGGGSGNTINTISRRHCIYREAVRVNARTFADAKWNSLRHTRRIARFPFDIQKSAILERIRYRS